MDEGLVRTSYFCLLSSVFCSSALRLSSVFCLLSSPQSQTHPWLLPKRGPILRLVRLRLLSSFHHKRYSSTLFHAFRLQDFTASPSSALRSSVITGLTSAPPRRGSTTSGFRRRSSVFRHHKSTPRPSQEAVAVLNFRLLVFGLRSSLSSQTHPLPLPGGDPKLPVFRSSVFLIRISF